MEAKVIKDEKNLICIELDNQTIAEIFRVYLNEDDSVDFAAWKKERPGSSVIMEIRTNGKSAKKALEDAAAKIEKETSKYADEFKKAIK